MGPRPSRGVGHLRPLDSDNGSINEDYLLKSVVSVLKACLPLEGYDPGTERFVTQEIILKVSMGAIP